MRRLYEAVRSFLLWFGIALLAVLIGTVAFFASSLAVPFDRKRRSAHLWPWLWARSVVALNWRTELDTRRLPRGKHFVIVANHQSLADIIVCLHVWHNFKFLAKQSVFRVPFLGWFMYPAGYIPLVRGKRSSVEEAMERCRFWLRRGVSVLLYPEGTRSPDGSVREFKPGAFRLAIETGVPILPIALGHTADMLPKNSFFFTHKKDSMKLLVGDPIPVDGLTLDDVDALAERTRQAIIAMKDRLESGGAGDARAAA